MTTQTPTGRTDQAREEGKELVEDAMEKAGEVGRQVMTESRHVMNDMRNRARDQADAQGRRAAGSLRVVASQLGAMAQASDESGMVIDLARDGANRIEQLADHLERDGVQGIITDIESFARRRPGMFLAVGFGLGLVLARVVRSGDSTGMKQAISEAASSGTPDDTAESFPSSRSHDYALPDEPPFGAAGVRAGTPTPALGSDGTAQI